MEYPDGSVTLHSLRQLSQSIYDGRRLPSLLSALMDRAADLPGVDTVRILLLDHERNVLVAQPGTFPGAEGDPPIPLGVGFAGRIGSTRRLKSIGSAAAVRCAAHQPPVSTSAQVNSANATRPIDNLEKLMAKAGSPCRRECRGGRHPFQNGMNGVEIQGRGRY